MLSGIGVGAHVSEFISNLFRIYVKPALFGIIISPFWYDVAESHGNLLLLSPISVQKSNRCRGIGQMAEAFQISYEAVI